MAAFRKDSSSLAGASHEVKPAFTGAGSSEDGEVEGLGAHGTTAASEAGQQHGKRKTKKEPKKYERDPVRNREIQARYRSRLKEKAENLVAQHASISEELQQAKQELANLQHANSIMESVKAVRDESIQALEDVASAPNDSAPPLLHTLIRSVLAKRNAAASSGRAAAAWAADPADSIDPADPPEGEGAAAAPQLETAPITPGLASALLHPGYDPIEAAANELGAIMEGTPMGCEGDAGPRMQDQGGGSLHMFDPLAATFAVQASPSVVEVLQRSTPDDFLRGWQKFIDRLRDLLAEYNLTRSKSVLGELKRWQEQWAVLIGLALLHSPTNLQHMMASDLSGEVSEEEDRAKCDALVVAMELSDAERMRYMQLYEAYTQRMQALRQNKEGAVQKITEGAVGSEQLDAMGLGEMMAQYLRVFDGATSLSANLDIQFICTLELLKDVSMMWNVFQKAQVLLAFAPNFPDVLKLLHAVGRAQAAAEPVEGGGSEVQANWAGK